MKTKLLLLFIVLQFVNGNAQIFGSKTLVTPANNNVSSLVFADIDADGDKDILCTSETSNQVFWYKNLGSETFSTKTLISSSYSQPATIKLLDIDEDGKKDLVIGERTSGAGISWIKNMGGGFFGTKQSLPHCGICALSSIEVGDVDSDGKDDIIIAELSNDYMTWTKNTGGGVFVEQGMLYNAPDGINIHSYTFGDLDQDNINDIIISTGATSNQKVMQLEYVNNAFVETPIYTATSDPYIYDSFLSDLDHDGMVDVVTNSSDCALYWFKNFGANTYSSLNPIGLASCATGSLSSLGDLDLDNNTDMVYSKNANLYWRKNQGAATFDSTVLNISVGAIVGNVDQTFLVDIDTDNDLDVFYISASELGWFKNNSSDLATTEFNTNTLSAYPNPVKDVLHIAAEKEISTAAIFNLLGQQVAVKSLNGNEGTIDMSNLHTGTYFVKVQSDNAVKTLKVIKQ